MDSQSHSKKNIFPILPVVQKYLKTMQRGSNHWAVCPFHNDSSPSLSISQEKNIFKCFSCNVSGDAISFVMKIQKCNYVVAVRKIAEILNLNPNDYLNERENEYQRLYKINEIIAFTYHKYLLNENNKEYLDYLLNKRHLSLEIIKKYKIGYAPEHDILNSVLDTYLSKNIKETWGINDINKTGIFNILKDGKRIPYFRERIIFPIFNDQNQIIAFSGRNIKGEEPKYLNLRNNEIFTKKNSIFNIQNLEENKPVYLFEGFIDLLKCEQKGFSNGIACMGGTIDFGIFQIIQKYSKEIYLCLDNDESGQSFNLNIGKALIQNGFLPKVVDLFEYPYKDIDEFLDKDSIKAKDQLNNPIDFFEWWFKLEKKNKKLSNISLFQSFLNSCLECLFLKTNENLVLRTNIDPQYAKRSIKKIFSFYKFFDLLDDECNSIIEKNIQSYNKIILSSTLSSTNFSPIKNVYSEEITSVQPYSKITNPFLLLAIKYQKIIKYFLDNKSTIVRMQSWHFSIPEKFLNVNEEINVFFNILKPLETQEIEGPKLKIMEFLRNYSKNAKDVNTTEDFFNFYYSFNLEYITLLINLNKSDRNLSIEERWLKIEDLKDLLIEISKKASKFFLSSEFFKKNIY